MGSHFRTNDHREGFPYAWLSLPSWFLRATSEIGLVEAGLQRFEAG